MKRRIISFIVIAALFLTFSASQSSVSAAGSDSIYSSDVHKNNTGKILFSESSIKAGKETASQFTDKFTADSRIYGIAYLDSKIQSIAKKTDESDGTYIPYETVQARAEISVDGDLLYTNSPVEIPMNIQDYEANKAYITFEIIPDPKDTVGYSFTNWYENLFLQLDPGSHEVSIDFLIGFKKIASGSFNIDWENADLENLLQNAKDCTKIASDYRAKLRKMPVQFSQKNSPYKDPLLSDKNLKAMIKEAYSDCKKITKLVTFGKSSNSWYVEKDDYGIPDAKISTKFTWAIYESTDGWSYIIQVQAKCDYEGGGVYGEPYIDPLMNKAKIATKNVK